MKHEISSITQLNLFVIAYYTKLKRLWDELTNLRPSSARTCHAATLHNEINNTDILIQFPMGLNDSYDHVKNQILIMKPLSTVNKTYSMMLSVEKEREVETINLPEGMFATFYVNPKDNPKPPNRKKEKDSRVCVYYKNIGHTRDTYFKLHGYPKEFTELKGKRNKEKANAVTNDVRDGTKT